ncbi:MAG: hypothetical protein ACK5MD_08410 [Flavobacteriales bacterium]
MKNLSQKLSVVLMTSLPLLMLSCENPKKQSDNIVLIKNDTEPIETPVKAENSIQVALLLDTSNSMDGLIDQAKSRLWNIVNTLTTLKYKGHSPDIQISLYEYGNSGLSKDTNYIRQVTPLTTDLDLISEKLFALRTNGGNEYCGAVIKASKNQLDWDDNTKSMKLIYIAGNEGFNQGGVDYREAISDVVHNNIYVNTIFCGDKQEGINLQWKEGAVLGNGKYFNIDSNRKIHYIVTPYDDQIDLYNSKLNDTYVGYGTIGYEKKELQSVQDSNAESISKQNKVERIVAKSKKNAYKNSSWDLVDKYEENKAVLEDLEETALPEELKGRTKEEKEAYIKKKKDEREKIQKEIKELSKKRAGFIKTQQKDNPNTEDDLGKAIEKSILEIALANGFNQG